jgi:hypothetical protein
MNLAYEPRLIDSVYAWPIRCGLVINVRVGRKACLPPNFAFEAQKEVAPSVGRLPLLAQKRLSRVSADHRQCGDDGSGAPRLALRYEPTYCPLADPPALPEPPIPSEPPDESRKMRSAAMRRKSGSTGSAF